MAKSTMVCGWNSSVHWARCSDGRHGESTYGSCQFVGDFVDNAGNPGFPPYPYLVTTYSCVEEVDETLMPTDPGGGSGGGVAGGDNPDQCTTVAGNPREVGIVDENGCHVGGATQPNDTRPKNPCRKIKEQREDEEFSKRIDTLKTKITLKKETGYIQKFGGDYVYKDNAGASDNANTLSLPHVETNTYIKGFIHTHVNDYEFIDAEGYGIGKKGIKMFSPADIVYFMDLVKNAQTKVQPLSDVYAVMVSGLGNYQIRFTGNENQIKTFTDAQKEAYKDPFIDFITKNKKMSLELKFLKFIDENMNLKGITLYRMNSDGSSTEIKLNDDKTDTIDTNCPQ